MAVLTKLKSKHETCMQYRSNGRQAVMHCCQRESARSVRLVSRNACYQKCIVYFGTKDNFEAWAECHLTAAYAESMPLSNFSGMTKSTLYNFKTILTRVRV